MRITAPLGISVAVLAMLGSAAVINSSKAQFGGGGTPVPAIWVQPGAPSGVGSDGDMFVSTTAPNNMYTKSAGAWSASLGALQGVAGAAGVNAYGTPNALSPAFSTATQATDPTRPAIVTAMIETTYSISIAGTQSDTVELRIGPVQATVANGTGGTAVATFKASLTGIALTIGMAQISRNQLTANLPTGWYWALRRVTGTTAVIVSATDQPVG